MKNKFFLFISFLLLSACSNEQKSIHPALLNPVVKPYTDAIAQDTANAELFFKRAEMLNKLELPELTRLDLEKAVQLAPQNIQYRESLASLLIDQSASEAALEQVKQLQKQSPKDTNYIVLEAEAYLVGNQLAKADTIIQELLRIVPNHPYVLLDASKIAAAAKDTAAAISYAQKLVAVAPKYYDGVYQLADLYSESKKPEAVKWYEKLYRMDSLNAYPFYDLARYYRSIDNVPLAKQFLIKAINVEHDFVKAYLDYGKILLTEDSVDKADRQFQIAIEVAPADAEGYYNKGMVCLMKNNKDLAKKFFEQALVFNGNHKGARSALAKLN